MIPMQRRALKQVKEAGRKGLQVECGQESITQMQLVESGHLWQEHGERNHWKFTLSPSGESQTEREEKRNGKTEG